MQTPSLTKYQGSGQVDRGPEGASLARGLGWFSLGLGLAGIVAPGVLARAVGVADNRRSRVALRALGARELASGAAILAGRPSPVPLWSRVLGDAMDLAVLGLALRARRTHTSRALVAMAAVAGVAALDVFTALRLRRSIAVAKPARASVTINRTPVQVYAAWRNLHDLPHFIDSLSAVRMLDTRRSRWTAKAPAGLTVEWDAELVDDRPGERIAWRTLPGSDIEHEGSVTFHAAPGHRGTEVHWEMRRGGRGGRAAEVVAKAFAEHEMAADLRRFKQVMETGALVHSDASIHRGMHPAQPSHVKGELPS